MPLLPLVDGSLILVYGDPGVGKSRLITQVVAAAPSNRVLYVVTDGTAGDHWTAHVQRVCQARGPAGPQIEVFTEYDVGRMIEHSMETSAQVMVVDMIQGAWTSRTKAKAGSPSQIRACVDHLKTFATSTRIPVVLVGSTTKTGNMAGPIQLQHDVDAIFSLKKHPTVETYRVFQQDKNRYDDMQPGILQMCEDGLFRIPQQADVFPPLVNQLPLGMLVELPVIKLRRYMLVDATTGKDIREALGFEIEHVFRNANFLGIATLESCQVTLRKLTEGTSHG